MKVAVQGLGNVGYSLCQNLAEAGAELIATDINARNVERACGALEAITVEPDAIYDVDADVFAPCALGAVLTLEAVERFKDAVVTGAANNQLARSDVAELLRDRGILYAPDCVINAGGIINISHEDDDCDANDAKVHTARIADRLTEVFERATAEGRTTAEAADATARTKLKSSPPWQGKARGGFPPASI